MTTIELARWFDLTPQPDVQWVAREVIRAEKGLPLDMHPLINPATTLVQFELAIVCLQHRQRVRS